MSTTFPHSPMTGDISGSAHPSETSAAAAPISRGEAA